SPIIGSLSDQYGRRPVILLSCAGLAIDYVLMAVAPNLWWLAVGRIVAGVTSSSFTTIYAYMADVTPVEGRAKAYGLIGAAFSGGFVLGIPVLPQLIEDFVGSNAQAGVINGVSWRCGRGCSSSPRPSSGRCRTSTGVGR
ncbi:MFS transporter, partial [Enterobacter cloacae]|uniref:MFS transporter n=1 Tax=Enterobacter cloacae TaxID=550 RepID=UPI001C3EAA39